MVVVDICVVVDWAAVVDVTGADVGDSAVLPTSVDRPPSNDVVGAGLESTHAASTKPVTTIITIERWMGYPRLLIQERPTLAEGSLARRLDLDVCLEHPLHNREQVLIGEQADCPV